MIIGAAQIDNHVALSLVVADTLNETTSVDIATFECLQINRAAIFHVNGFRTNFGGEQKQEKGCRHSDHDNSTAVSLTNIVFAIDNGFHPILKGGHTINQSLYFLCGDFSGMKDRQVID